MKRVVLLLVPLGVATLMGAAQAPLRVLRMTPPFPPVGSGSISGRILSVGTDAPLRHARVQTTSAAGVVPVVYTDADGRFVVAGLVAGQYRLSVSKAGYVTTTYGARAAGDSGTAISVGDGAANVDVRLSPAAVISGQIVDSHGEPVSGMTVTADIISPAGRSDRGAVTVATTQTDDLGNYRLGGLAQGSFVIAASMHGFIVPTRGSRSDGTTPTVNMIAGAVSMMIAGREQPDPSAARMYYPGTPDVGQAQPIAVAAGEERSSIDLTVPALRFETVPAIVHSIIPDALTSMKDGVMTTDASRLGRAPCPRPPCSGAIRGRVTNAEGRPLRQAFVWLQIDGLPDSPPTLFTDDEGRYAFQRVGPGSYRVVAASAGYVTMQYGQTRPLTIGESIVLQVGDERDRIEIALPRLAAIAGRLLDDTGEPVEGVDMRVMRIAYDSGQRRLVNVPASLSRTDDTGRYRISGLQPGQYIVAADPHMPGSTMTYFPGAATASNAQLVSIDDGRPVAGVDFTLTSAPTARVAGIVAGAAEKGIPTVSLRTSSRSGSPDSIQFGADVRADGSFEFLYVPPGDYVLQAVSQLRSMANDEFAAVFVPVNSSDVTGLTIRTARGSIATGRITVEGPTPTGFDTDIDITSISIDSDRSPAGRTPIAGISPDLTLGFDGLMGPRVFRLTRAPREWALKAVRVDGVDVTDTPIVFGLPGQPTANLEIVLTDRVSEVAGKVTDARGRPVSAATVVVFAADRQLWTAASRFLMTAKTGRDGTFSIRGLPPAEYFAAATDSVADGEWMDPAFLESVFPSATRVTLLEGERLSINPRLVTR